MNPLSIRVIEPLTGDVLSPEDVANMKLPFDTGWEMWGLYKNNSLLFVSSQYEQVAQAVTVVDAMIGVDRIAA